MKANKKLIIIAVVIGIITVFALNYYIQDLYSDSPAMVSSAPTNVVVARVTIPEHTRITADMVSMESISADAVHPEALKNTQAAVGGISRSEIVRGEQVLGNRVATEERRASLSYRIPENLRGITIPVGEVSGVSGYVSPGDKVDVLVTYNIFDDEAEAEAAGGEHDDTLTVYTVLQNIMVLATGQFTKEADDEERRVVGNVTLAVTPEQAEVLTFAYHEGSFHLTLRSPLDEDVVDLEYYNIENFETFRER